jgi:hypothetical protein
MGKIIFVRCTLPTNCATHRAIIFEGSTHIFPCHAYSRHCLTFTREFRCRRGDQTAGRSPWTTVPRGGTFSFSFTLPATPTTTPPHPTVLTSLLRAPTAREYFDLAVSHSIDLCNADQMTASKPSTAFRLFHPRLHVCGRAGTAAVGNRRDVTRGDAA